MGGGGLLWMFCLGSWGLLRNDNLGEGKGLGWVCGMREVAVG